MSTHAPDSQEFFELVQRTGRYLRRHTLLVGGVLVLLATIGWLTCAVAVDLLMPLTMVGRVCFAVGFWLLLLGASSALVGWPALRRVKLEEIALGIERAIGGMHNRLLTVLDLHRADHPDAHATDPEMLARLISQTRTRLAGFRAAQLVNRVAMRRSLAALGGALVVATLLAAVFWDRAPTALARILRPTADIAPVTWLRIDAPGDLQVAHGDPLTLQAEITRGTTDELFLQLQQPDGNWVTYPMQSAGPHGFTYTLNGITADYRYKISGGGTWTSVFRIQQVPRPVVESLAAAIRLPRYMEREALIPVPDDAKRVEAPLDSRIFLTATVSGDVAGGEILLLKRTTSVSEQVHEEERVWFEDELPADAATETPWRWSTSQVHSGLKAFTFNRGRQPFGFATRLNPLHVPAEASVYCYIWLDPADAPGWLSIRLGTAKNSQSVEWGDAPASAGRDRKRIVLVGPLPQPGRWERLEVPAKRLEGDKGGGLKLNGMTLTIDRGQVFFDRPGYLTRTSQNVETVQLEQVAEFPMTKDELSEEDAAKSNSLSDKVSAAKPTTRWSGQLPVEGNELCTVRFRSALKQTSAEREPLEIVATTDQPPSLVVEKPAQDVVLPELRPLNVTGRALDDWGIETVGLQIGPSATTLGPARWQPRAEKFATSRDILVTIDPQAEHLSAGESLMYRLVAKDCHGQVTESPTYKLSIATPDKASAPETAKPPESLDKLADAVDRMAEAEQKAKALAAFLDSLPAELRDAVDANGNFKKPDGSDMSREEVQKLVGDAQKKLTKEQKKQLAELTAELNKRRQEMQQLADQLGQAAKEAEKNPLAAQREAELLKNAAKQAADMAQQLSPPTASKGEPAALERVLKTQQAAAEQPKQLAELEQQLRQLEAARKQMASDPQLARQMLDAQAAQQQAAAAAEQLHDLAEAMQAREKQLNALEAQEAALSDQSKQADGKQLDSISKQQTKLDNKALAAVDDLRRDLGKKPIDEKGALTPWTPPGKPEEAKPAAKDSPAEPTAKDSPKAKGKAKGAEKSDAKPDSPAAENKGDKSAKEESDWDKPVESPEAGKQPGKPGEADKNRDKPADASAAKDPPNAKPKNDEAAASPPTGETPRERLTAHQDQMRQALRDGADEARKMAERAQALADKLNQQAAGKQPAAQPPTDKQSPDGQQAAGKTAMGKEPPGQPAPSEQPPAGPAKTGQSPPLEPRGNTQPSSSQNTKPQTQNPSPSDPQGETQTPSAVQLNDAAQAIKETLTSPEVRQALATAARASANSQSKQPPSEQSADKSSPSSPSGNESPKTVGTRPGPPPQDEAAPLGSDPRDRAQLYKLPPRVRDPLLEGMQEKGPEGYQPLIDAYFRELSKEIK